MIDCDCLFQPSGIPLGGFEIIVKELVVVRTLQTYYYYYYYY